MSLLSLTFEGEFQPYVSQQGASDLLQANWTGKGYARYTPTIATMFTDTPAGPAGGAGLPTDGRHAYVMVKAGGIRVRTDATNPTPTEGLYVPAGTLIKFTNQRQMLLQFRFIDSATETSEVSCMWFV